MSTDYLPLTLDVSHITITETCGGWECVLHLNGEKNIYIYKEMPDMVYEQLFDSNQLTVNEDGEVVQA